MAMSNTYFRFKEFTIHQDKCAMKVSTDACVQGAWTHVPQDCKRVLDIGTGTGLLTLMLAQKAAVFIDAIEIDESAVRQATENIAASKWADTIRVIQADAVNYRSQEKYSLIISNPPFFNNSLLGKEEQRNKARHTLSLSYQELFITIKENLAQNGKASILLPAEEFAQWEKLLEDNGWQVTRKLLVYPTVGKAANRVVAICEAGTGKETITEELYIRESGNVYTQEFCRLMSPYYLNL